MQLELSEETEDLVYICAAIGRVLDPPNPGLFNKLYDNMTTAEKAKWNKLYDTMKFSLPWEDRKWRIANRG